MQLSPWAWKLELWGVGFLLGWMLQTWKASRETSRTCSEAQALPQGLLDEVKTEKLVAIVPLFYAFGIGEW